MRRQSYIVLLLTVFMWVVCSKMQKDHIILLENLPVSAKISTVAAN